MPPPNASDYHLNSSFSIASLLLLTGLFGFFVAAEAVRAAVAEKLAESPRVEDIRRSLQLDPSNPDLHERLGLFFEWKQLDDAEAVTHTRKAIALNPNKVSYWSNLGRECFVTGDDACVQKAFLQIDRLAPAIPRYQWQIANGYLLIGRSQDSLVHFERFLRLRPEESDSVFRVCSQVFEDPQTVWRALLPRADVKTKLGYVSFLFKAGLPEPANRLWNEIAKARVKMYFSDAASYFEELLAAHDILQASKVWHDLELAGAISAKPSGENDNHIFNGSFEQYPLMGGFDWRDSANRYLNVDFADRSSYQGNYSLRVDFTVPRNETVEAAYEFVPVSPETNYLLSAYVRSSEITSDSGPRLRITDAYCAPCLTAESESTVGTKPWHKVSVNFRTGARTRLVRVSAWRPLSRSFPTEIQGRFWLDSVVLTSSDSKAQGADGNIIN